MIPLRLLMKICMYIYEMGKKKERNLQISQTQQIIENFCKMNMKTTTTITTITTTETRRNK